MKSIKFLIFIFITASLCSCKEDKAPIKDTTVTTYYFIRHAEKDRSNIEDTNPELSQEGLGRAIRWAEVFDNIPLDAIYITDYERTSMTAAPISIKQEITTQFYNPEELDVEQMKQDYKGLNVLIIGHSNTTPTLVNKMIGEEKYETLDEYDNSSLFIVRFIGDEATDIHLNID